MTDELIQQQIPQQRGSYAIPGLITGAAIGGAAGVAGAHYKNWGLTEKPDLDKVFAQKPDEFESMAKRAGDNKSKIEEAKNIVKGVQDLESQYDEKIAELQKTGGINDSDLPENLRSKKTNITSQYNARLEQLVTQEKTKLGGPAIEGIDVRNPQFKDLGWFAPADYVEDGKDINCLNRYRASNEYTTMTDAVRNASTNVSNTLNRPGQPLNLRTSALQYTTSTRPSSIADLFKVFEAQYNAASDAKKPNIFNKTEIRSGAEVTTTAYNQAYNLARSLYTDPSAINNPNTQFEHYLKFGEFVEGAKPIAPVGGQVLPMSYVDGSGHHTGWIKYTDEAKTQYESQLRASVEAQRVTTAEQFLARANNYATLRQQIQPNELINSIKAQFNGAEYLEGLGNINATDSLCDKVNWIDVDKILNESRKNTYNITVDGTQISGYEYDIIELKKAVENKSMPTHLNGSYFDAAGNKINDPKKALEMAEKRSAVANAHKELKTTLQKQIEECLTDNNYIRDLDAKIAKAYAEDKPLLEALSKLTTRFNKIFKEGSANAGDIEARAKAAAEELIKNENISTQLKSVQDEIAKYAEEKGLKGELSLEDAVKKFGKSKEEFVKSAKDEAKTKLETLFKDVKFANKTTTGLLAAAVVGLVGLGLGAASKKSS